MYNNMKPYSLVIATEYYTKEVAAGMHALLNAYVLYGHIYTVLYFNDEADLSYFKLRFKV